MRKKADWQEQIKLAKDYRRKHNQFDRWSDIVMYFRHRFSDDTIPFNLVYLMYSALRTALYFRDPFIRISPRKPQVKPFTDVVESAANYFFEELDFGGEFKDTILYAYLFNVGPVQVGYNFGEGSQNIDETMVELLMREKDGITRASPFNVNMKPNMPWIEAINPLMFLTSWGTRKLSNSRWCAKGVWKPVEYIKRKYGYKPHSHSIIPNADTMNPTIGFFTNDMYEQSRKEPHVFYWEVHDYENGKMLGVKEDGEYIFEPVDDDTQVEGLPFEALTFNDDPTTMWGVPDPIYIEPQMKEGNQARTYNSRARKVSLMKAIARRGTFDEESIEQFLSDDMLPFIEIDGDPEQAISLISPHVYPDLVNYAESIFTDVQKLMGFGHNQLAGLAPGRRTAQEVNLVQSNYESRIDERRGRLGKVVQRCLRRVLQLAFDNWTDPILTQVLGQDGAMYWVEYKPDTLGKIRGEYDLEVDVDSMKAQSKETRKGEAVEILASLSKLGPMLQDANLNIKPILGELLKQFDWVDVKAVLPQAPETQQRPMQLQEYVGQQRRLQGNPSAMQARRQQMLGGIMR